jgi:hypothetical protein
MPGTRFDELFRVLADHDVDYVLVGGAAAVLGGAFLATEDLDIVPDLEPGNVDRLLAAFEELQARYFDPAGREIRPDRERLESLRLHLLVTRFGRLDVMREVGDAWGYADLVSRSRIREVSGRSILCLDLEGLIAAKEKSARPKDLAHLPILREALRLRQARDA